MDTDRRNALKAMGASGLALAMPNLGWAAAERAKEADSLPLYVMAHHSDARSGFGAGAMLACRACPAGEHPMHVISGGLRLEDVNHVNALLQGRQPVRLIGFVDEATAAVVISLVRSANARLHWLAQHRVTGDHARHVVQVATSDLCCEQLEEQFASMRSPEAVGESWAAQLGYSLSRLHTEPASRKALANLAAPQRTGSYVSFSLDTQGALHG